MSIKTIEPILEKLKTIAYEAGDKIMEIYLSDDIQAAEKEDKSPVTKADLAAHHHIADALAALSEFPVVSEEDADSMANRNSDSWFWIIDPLDGTKEFLNKNGEFTVNIALVGHGKTQFGIVYAPAIDLMYWSENGTTAYRSHNGVTEQIKVSASEQAECRVVASKSHLNEETAAFIEKLGEVSLIQSGSSLKLCRVAEGMADIYPRLAPTCEWDTAAAHAILEAAGGRVVDLDGNSLRYGKTEILNPSFIATRDTSLIPA